MYLFLLGINSLDFLLYHFEVSLEFLNLTVHFFYQTIALFAGCVEETKVVLVSSDFIAQLVVAAQEFATLIAECIDAFLGNILQVVLEVVKVALGIGGVKFLIGSIDSLMILFVDLVFFFERNVSDSTVLLGKILEFLLEIVVGNLCNYKFLELGNNVALLVQIGMFLAA